MLLVLAGCGLTPTKDAGEFDDLVGDEVVDTSWIWPETGYSGCPSGGRDFTWVVSELAVGAADAGVDLDGDGIIDNTLSFAADTLNAAIAAELDAGSFALVLQFWALDDWCADESFWGGLVVAEDTDGDPSDNYLGGETFAAPDGLDEEGHADLSAEASVSDSLYGVWIPGASVELGGLVLEAATPIVLEGTATPTANTGVFGFGVAATTLRAIAEENGVDPELVDSLADLDSDGDGAPDALSVGFVFNAVSCRIE